MPLVASPNEQRAMTHPHFTVVTPAFNAARWIHRCVESVLSQSFPLFEYLVIDDGSKDDTGKILDGYAQKDSRMIVFHQQNCGYVATMNTLVRLARGSYIVAVDSDNWISSNLLQTLFNCCQAYGVLDFIQFSEVPIRSENFSFPDKTTENTETFCFRGQKEIDAAIDDGRLPFLSHSGCALLAEHFKRFPLDGYPAGSDTRLMEKLYFLANKIGYCPGMHLYRLMREESLSSKSQLPKDFYAISSISFHRDLEFFVQFRQTHKKPLRFLLKHYYIFVCALKENLKGSSIHLKDLYACGSDIWRNRDVFFGHLSFRQKVARWSKTHMILFWRLVFRGNSAWK